MNFTPAVDFVPRPLNGLAVPRTDRIVFDLRQGSIGAFVGIQVNTDAEIRARFREAFEVAGLLKSL